MPTLGKITGYPLTQADDLFDATENLDGFVRVSSCLKACAVNLSKMCNDLRSSRNLQKAGIRSVIMSAVPIPISTLIFPRMYCIWQIWDSSRFLLSRLSHSRPMNMHCRKRIFRFSLKNMINWQPRWSAVTGKEILSISFIS